MSKYTYRLITTPGIEHVLVKELQSLGFSNAKKLKTRKAVEVNGSLKDLYKIMYSSRLAENIQIRPVQQFLARGDKELDKNLSKVPWHAFLPLKNFQKYKFPYVNSKTFQSNLYHTKKVSDIVKLHINELPIKREYNHKPLSISYRAFRQNFRERLKKENEAITEFKHQRNKNLNRETIGEDSDNSRSI
jgi:23S rRNA G2445 N2-methylase RlmL